MIESFIKESESISVFAEKKNIKMNKLIAKIGINACYKMMIYDNFVHADCHGGNILISKIPESEKKTEFQKKLNSFSSKIYDVISKLEFNILKLIVIF